MNYDSKRFGEMLFKLNSKVNKRSSYLHDLSLKYHRGNFSHGLVISNIKNEPCLQTPRAYMPVDYRLKSNLGSSMESRRIRRSVDDSFSLPLKASLAKFYRKPKYVTPNRSMHEPKKLSMSIRLRGRIDANNNTD